MRNGKGAKECSEYCNIIWLVILGNLGAFYYGFFYSFKGLQFLEKGYKNSCSRIFFQHFFFFFTDTHITIRQSGGEGWWVVNSPCLTVTTTHT